MITPTLGLNEKSSEISNVKPIFKVQTKSTEKPIATTPSKSGTDKFIQSEDSQTRDKNRFPSPLTISRESTPKKYLEEMKPYEEQFIASKQKTPMHELEQKTADNSPAQIEEANTHVDQTNNISVSELKNLSKPFAKPSSESPKNIMRPNLSPNKSLLKDSKPLNILVYSESLISRNSTIETLKEILENNM